MQESLTFSELLDRVKDEKRLTDVEIADLIDVDPTYISKIRKGKKRASEKLIRRLHGILSGKIKPLIPELPWDEIVRDDTVRFASSCGMSVPTFIVECLRRFAEKTSDQIRSEIKVKQRKAAEISSTLKPAVPGEAAADVAVKVASKEFEQKSPTGEPNDEA